MEIFVNTASTVFIMGPEGLRYPNYDEAEFTNKSNDNKIVDFGTATSSQPISKCKCKKDEIIIEKTKHNVLKLTTGYKASKDLYPLVLALATQGNYKLEINKCENMRDMYELDKAIQAYMEVYNQT